MLVVHHLGDWHAGLTMLQSIMTIFWDGLLEPLKSLLSWKKIWKDARKCFYQGSRLVLFVYEELVSVLMHSYVPDNLTGLCTALSQSPFLLVLICSVILTTIGWRCAPCTCVCLETSFSFYRLTEMVTTLQSSGGIKHVVLCGEPCNSIAILNDIGDNLRCY